LPSLQLKLAGTGNQISQKMVTFVTNAVIEPAPQLVERRKIRGGIASDSFASQALPGNPGEFTCAAFCLMPLL
jgi:hypothetical protein